MENKYRRLPLSVIDINDGQINGLQRNPRSWTYDDVERIKASIEETPELLDARGIIVVPYRDRYVALGGNLRLTALRSLGWKDVNCYILPEDTPVSKMREIVIKDNGSFGDWDFSKLNTEWAECPLSAWGVPEYFDTSNDLEEEEDLRYVLSVEMTEDEYMFVKDRLGMFGKTSEEGLLNLIQGGR